MARNALLLTDAVPRSRDGSVAKKLLNRGQLLRMLETKRLVTEIRIDAQARLTLDHVGWEEYWLPVKLMGQTDGLLRNLETAWSAYIDGGFPAAMRREYCLRYFQLLHAVIERWLTDPTKETSGAALRQVVGFESFIIVSLLDTDGEAAAAATSTVRDPAYLLTKSAFRVRWTQVSIYR